MQDRKNRKLRMGMVGGGRGAFIGAVHRMAAVLDGQIELVCGAFSSDPERSRLSGADLLLPPERCYGTYQEMIERESALPESERMDFISVVTPNNVHVPPSRAALEAGFDVICDKPLAFNLDEARELKKVVASTGRAFALTHNYTGYPMVKQARVWVREGRLGTLRKVVVEYPQGWLGKKIEEDGQKQAAWRTDPARAGAAGCVGDIGTHAENLAETITGLKIRELAADLTTFVKGRKLDDDANILLRFEGGAKGILHSSQISTGEENGLNIRVYGEKGGLEWHQMEPNTLWFKPADGPVEKWRTGMGYVAPEAACHTRIPAGHPEGYLEAFANIYRNFATDLRRRDGQAVDPDCSDCHEYPDIDDGVRGMAFIEAVVASSRANAAWTSLAA
ncbi:MAG: Gfo/Idh/MocA family protein [Candidatus Methylacidiphilales bacterium]